MTRFPVHLLFVEETMDLLFFGGDDDNATKVIPLFNAQWQALEVGAKTPSRGKLVGGELVNAKQLLGLLEAYQKYDIGILPSAFWNEATQALNSKLSAVPIKTYIAQLRAHADRSSPSPDFN